MKTKLEETGRMFLPGWHAADLHIHTNYSYDALPSAELNPEVLYEKARRKGFTFVTFTDHDTMDAYNKIGWQHENIVTGVEISIKDQKRIGHTLHVNVYLLCKKQFLELMEISKNIQNIEIFLKYLEENNLPFIYNHPFWHQFGEKPSYEVIDSLISLFPVIEYNMHRVRKKNRLALGLALKYGKGVVATTDSHVGYIGRAYTVAKGKDFREYFANITAGNANLVTKDFSVQLFKEEASEWLEYIFHSKINFSDIARICSKQPVRRLFSMALAQKIPHGPKMKKATGYMLNTVCKSGVPAFFYVTLQNLRLRKTSRNSSTINDFLDKSWDAVIEQPQTVSYNDGQGIS